MSSVALITGSPITVSLRRLHEQVQIPLNVTAIAPFVAEPRLQLGYQVEGHAVGQSLALPVAVTKFCSPPDAPLPRDLFFSQWRALGGASPCRRAV